MTKVNFPWIYVITNAIWIFGLAVVLAAFGWHEFQAHSRKRKLGEFLGGDSFLKPLYGGLTLVAGGLALSVRGVILKGGFAVLTFGFLYLLVRRCRSTGGKALGVDDEKPLQAPSAAGCASSGLGNLSADHDAHPTEEGAEAGEKRPVKKANR